MKAFLLQLVRQGRHSARAARRFRQLWRSSVGTYSIAPAGPFEEEPVEHEIFEWSVYRGTLRARLVVHDLSAPAFVYFVLGERALRFRLHSGEQSFSVPLAGFPGPEVRLVFAVGGRFHAEQEPALRALAQDASSALFTRFVEEVQQLPAGRVLEIGSRARSGTTYRGFLPSRLSYVGLDIVSGPNVDVVGDAHDLTAVFGDGEFRLVYAIAVFEHLAMPWKAALSINRVLADGGLVFVGTHQTFPVHEAPWDFWRFSDRAFHSLFNAATGFEVIATAMGQPADIVPHAALASVSGVDAQPAYLASSVLARKIGTPRASWDVSLDDVSRDVYPN